MMHSSTLAGSIPARLTASATTIAPSLGAVKSFSAPRNFPVGMPDGADDDGFSHQLADDVVAQKGAQTFDDDDARAFDLAAPARVAALYAHGRRRRRGRSSAAPAPARRPCATRTLSLPV